MRADNDQSSSVLDRSSAIVEDVRPPSQSIDVLSDVLRAVRLRGALFFLTDATSPWSVAIPAGSSLLPAVLTGAQTLISFHMVTKGRCWCDAPGMEPFCLETGDVVVMPRGDPYRLSHPAAQPCEWSHDALLAFFREMAAGRLPFVVKEGGNGSEEVHILCGFLGCDMVPYNPALDTLPAVLHVPRLPGTDDSRLAKLVELSMEESSHRRAGSDCVLLRLAELMFVEVVRRHVASLATEERGWLAGLRDPTVGRALSLLHAQPQRSWTLVELAREAGLSRSALAERFAHFVGTPPMQYLVRWRMQTAARLLFDGDAKVAAVAAAVGYESEASFSRAFTRVVGVSPAAWRRRRASQVSTGSSAIWLK